jgi:Undecaprenyl-phosphate glucose phosphotransferase
MNNTDPIWRPPVAPLAPKPSNHRLTALASDLLPLIDLLCLVVASVLSTWIYLLWQAPRPPSGLSAGGIGRDFVHATLIGSGLAAFVLYDKRFGAIAGAGSWLQLLRSHGLRFSIFAGGVSALVALSPTLAPVATGWLALWLLTSLFLTSLTRYAMANHVRRLQIRGRLTEVVAVVGAGIAADRLTRALRQTRSETIEMLGIFDDRVDRTETGATPPTGNLNQLIALGKTRHIDWILVTLPPNAEQRLLELVERLKTLAVPIGLCPQHVGSALPYQAIDFVGDRLPVGLLADRPIKRWNAVVKLTEDFVIGGVAVLLLLPLLVLIAIAIKLDSPGPVIFKQRRHAVDNHEFEIYKFRTMVWTGAATPGRLEQTLRGDDRITHVGRFLRASSLDELPQLFNVLRGDMSLVGPRPHATNMRTENRLGTEITALYTHRHRVKPGITGWAQVNGARGATHTTGQLQRRVDLDLDYIKNWSLLLDLKILALTSRAVFKGTNAY